MAERSGIFKIDPETQQTARREELVAHLEGWESDLRLAQKGRYQNGRRFSSAERRLMATRALKEIRDIEGVLERLPQSTVG